MIRSITRQKPEEEIDRLLDGFGRVFIIGCGTCVTLTRTGGEPEVKEIGERLSKKGKLVTGHVVLPVACDNLTSEALKEYGKQIDQADLLLVFYARTVNDLDAHRYLFALVPNPCPAPFYFVALWEPKNHPLHQELRPLELCSGAF